MLEVIVLGISPTCPQDLCVSLFMPILPHSTLFFLLTALLTFLEGQ